MVSLSSPLIIRKRHSSIFYSSIFMNLNTISYNDNKTWIHPKIRFKNRIEFHGNCASNNISNKRKANQDRKLKWFRKLGRWNDLIWNWKGIAFSFAQFNESHMAASTFYIYITILGPVFRYGVKHYTQRRATSTIKTRSNWENPWRKQITNGETVLLFFRIWKVGPVPCESWEPDTWSCFWYLNSHKNQQNSIVPKNKIVFIWNILFISAESEFLLTSFF